MVYFTINRPFDLLLPLAQPPLGVRHFRTQVCFFGALFSSLPHVHPPPPRGNAPACCSGGGGQYGNPLSIATLILPLTITFTPNLNPNPCPPPAYPMSTSGGRTLNCPTSLSPPSTSLSLPSKLLSPPSPPSPSWRGVLDYIAMRCCSSLKLSLLPFSGYAFFSQNNLTFFFTLYLHCIFMCPNRCLSVPLFSCLYPMYIVRFLPTSLYFQFCPILPSFF